MFFIADTKSEKLLDALSLITQRDIRGCCEHKIYSRGVEYKSYNAVGVFHFSDAFNVVVTVSGTRNYKVKFRLLNDELLADCNCPYTDEYGDVCKHIVAALLSFEVLEVGTSELSTANSYSQPDCVDFRNYL